MSESQLCDVCGTVNVVAGPRCIGCGTRTQVTREDPGSRSGTEPPTHRVPDPDLDAAAVRQTVIESPPQPRRPSPTPDGPDSPGFEPPGSPAPELPDVTVSQTDMEKQVVQARSAATGLTPPPEGSVKGTKPHFVVRLLLPDGDRRSVEVSGNVLVVGSGLDELGLTGDSKIGEKEGRIYVQDGRLVLEPVEGATGIFRRISGEEILERDDVVLAGDVAAVFRPVGLGEAVDGTRQVLGGSANTSCGRLVFLRRDGSDGPVHDLPAGKTIVGRTDGHLNFPRDSRLSRRHVRFFASDQGVSVEDLDSRNGTYLRVRSKITLGIGDALRVGSAGIQIRSSS